MWQNTIMKGIKTKKKNLPYVFLTGFAVIMIIFSLLKYEVVINNVLHKVVATIHTKGFLFSALVIGCAK